MMNERTETSMVACAEFGLSADSGDPEQADFARAIEAARRLFDLSVPSDTDDLSSYRLLFTDREMCELREIFHDNRATDDMLCDTADVGQLTDTGHEPFISALIRLIDAKS